MTRMLSGALLGVLLAMAGCGGRASPLGTNDGGLLDGAYLVDDAGNIMYDDAGNPIPVPQDAAFPDAALPDDASLPLEDGASPQQDSGATPGTLECGSTTCTVGSQQCCITGAATATCIDASAQCQGLPVTCDGPEDCPAETPICCARLGGGGRGIRCVASCNATQLCNVDSDCPSGERCCGQGTLLGMSATWCIPGSQCLNTNPTEGVPCGSATCLGSTVCCISWSGQQCTTPEACQGNIVACDGPEDCPNQAPVCCGQISTGRLASQCTASNTCTGMGTTVICHSDGDCPSGQTCVGLFGTDLRMCQ